MRNEASTKSYALKKAIGFSAVHFVVGMTLAYVLTGQWAVALGVALIEPVINAGIIYFYSRYELGREKPECPKGARGWGLASGGAF